MQFQPLGDDLEPDFDPDDGPSGGDGDDSDDDDGKTGEVVSLDQSAKNNAFYKCRHAGKPEDAL